MTPKQEAALRQAREALVGTQLYGYFVQHSSLPHQISVALAAIDEALAEPKEKYRYGTPLLDAMTGNAEQPAQQGCMRCNTPKKCALYGCSPLTWPAEQPAQPYPDNFIDALKYDVARRDSEAQQQEPVVWMYQNKSTHEVSFQKHMRSFVDHGAWYEVPLYSEPLANQEKTSGSPKPAKPEALRLAELFEVAANAAPEGDEGWLKTAAELRRMHDLLGKANALCRIRAEEIERLKAQPAQEPVALDRLYIEALIEGLYQNEDPVSIDAAEEFQRLLGTHTSSPASKPWVGLTQQDIDIAFDDTQEGGGFNEFARAIEAKLREKNA